MTDSPIRFPGLFGDWAFTASGVAFHIGGKAIYWYGIIIALGVVLALWFCMTQREKYGITEDDLLDAVLWGVPLAIVGARLYYVIFYLDLFKKADGSFDWGSAIAIWDGGLAIYGGVIAAFLTGFVLCRKKGIKMGALTDLVVMGFLIGQAVGGADDKRHIPCPAVCAVGQELRQLIGGDLPALNAHGNDGSTLAHIGEDGFSFLLQCFFHHSIGGIFLLDLFLRQLNDPECRKGSQTLLVLCHALGKIFCVHFTNTDQVNILHYSFLFSG